MEKIAQDNYVTLEDLVRLLDSSDSTIRRDLGELEQEGKLHRVHGGAELIHSLQEELSNQEKSIKNSQIKHAIAQRAAEFVFDNDVIFLDAGTTTEFLIPFLQNKKVTVVTNSIHHATRLVDAGTKTIIIGGYVKQTTDASIGNVALEQIKQLNFDKAFLGMNGIDEDFLTTPDMEEAVIKKAVVANATTSYVLADATKLGQISFVKVAALEAVTIITESVVNPLLKKMKEKTKVIDI
ncbi:transcriptional regulator, DeoR family [Streptococcus ictaluri 707-05]|uniref:Transcriptional regulator, DeoR family n=2 Tax=Streptococcus ictaluri TaxID=380397 RepID=G5K3M3_9STRE|nr:transcriptional regulator, DeoR family [Streptococcus ictaluri 707-05]